ncbi:hypothetical protein LCE32_12960, partial [Streptomyces sp. 7G]|nr:hypothetical protein [Streptomyces sp. 7G]
PTPAAPAPAPARPKPAENGSAPQIQLIPAPVAGALDAAEEAVDLLLESGRAPGDILVLTTGEQHPWAAHELSFGEAAYWAQHDAGDDVFFADVSAADRAASRPVVVVAVNGDADGTVARTLPGGGGPPGGGGGGGGGPAPPPGPPPPRGRRGPARPPRPAPPPPPGPSWPVLRP